MKFIPLVLLLATLVAPRAGAAVVWDETINGDLPTALGLLQSGTNTINGAVGIGGGYAAGQFIDSDDVQFQLPTGTMITQFLVKTVSGNSYASFDLDRGSTIGGNTVGFGLFFPSDQQTDLLRFGTGKGPQPAGSYIFGISSGGTTDFKSYRLDIVIGAVPEPSTWALLGLGGAGLLVMTRRRRSRTA